MDPTEKKIGQIIGSIAPYAKDDSETSDIKDVNLDVEKLERSLREIIGLLDKNLVEALQRLQLIYSLLHSSKVKDDLKQLESHLAVMDRESAYKDIEKIVRMLNLTVK